jgi:hypothetical protein
MPSKTHQTTTEQGYGGPHQRERRRWRPDVAAGQVDCARCGERILPGDDWDLGHVDGDKSAYAGPEHQRCNRLAGSREGNARRWGHVPRDPGPLGPHEWVDRNGMVCLSVPVEEI